MYAIVQVGGRQYRVAAGQRLLVDRMAVEEGAQLTLDDVRMLVAEEGDEGETLVGTPRLDSVTVAATAIAHRRGRKLLVFKYKPKKRYRRKQGFRAALTELQVDEVRLGRAEAAPKPRRRPAAPAAEAPAEAAETSGTVGPAVQSEPQSKPAAKRAPASRSSRPVKAAADSPQSSTTPTKGAAGRSPRKQTEEQGDGA